ncbi:MAG: hypothetical protein ABIS45_09560 [Burkholderiales bacterium]
MRTVLIYVLMLCAALPAAAQRPITTPPEILDTLSSSAREPLTPDMREMAGVLARAPGNLVAAIRLSQLYYRFATQEGDLRFIGYARRVLDPWWNAPDAAKELLLMRANLRQYVHAFEAALADLNEALRNDPDSVEALALRTNIHTVRADYALARADCATMHNFVNRLMGTACLLSIDGLTGRAQRSYDQLLVTLLRARNASPAERAWVLTRLAEIAERLDNAAAAERHYRSALAVNPRDQYVLAALADFLLDQNRPREVIALLRERTASEHLLLRLVLAENAVGAPEFKAHSAVVGAAFDAARRGGYAVHEGDESRFALHVLNDPTRALQLALANWQLQRESRDARAVLEAAIAGGNPAAAQPVMDWMQRNDIFSVQLSRLAGDLRIGSAGAAQITGSAADLAARTGAR